jgi:tight adherence protein C
MMALISLFIVASITCVVWGIARDPSRRVIQRRVYSELASEDDRPRAGWLKGLEPLARLNRSLRLDRSRRLRPERFLLGDLAMSSSQFLVLKQLSAAMGVGLDGFWQQFQRLQPLWILIWGLVGFVLPELWLRRRILARRSSIARDLPEVVELLTLCVDAGADFMNALQRVVREHRSCPLRSELALVLQEVSVGKRRREAFRALAARVKVPEVNGFARAIIHADRMGVGMSQAMRIMSEDSRLRRYHQADRFAQKAPLKMLLPLICVMFSVLLIVAGPVLLQFFRGELFPKL